MVNTDNFVVINGVTFMDVTNQTVAGKVYTYEEAFTATQGRSVSYSKPASPPKPATKPKAKSPVFRHDRKSGKRR